MRKFFYFLFMVALSVAMPVAAEVNYFLSPVGFEDGVIPSGWTQENVQGSVLWAVEGGSGVTLSNPSGAHQGSYRLAARRPKNSSQGFVTRLISPSFDLTTSSSPQLCFSHSQVAFNSHFDTLRVYYRATAADEWKLLQEYTSAITGWQPEAIPLPENKRGTAYQIAFQVSDDAGEGVVLDDICVLQSSLCAPPAFQLFTINAAEAYIEFSPGGSGAGSPQSLFDVVISTSELSDPSEVSSESVVFHCESIGSIYIYTDKLTPETKYYVYIRTNCVDNATGYTDWVSETFTTPVRVIVPYTETFNGDSGAHGWTLKSRIEGESPKVPYVTTASQSSYSIDSTAYLAFVGSTATYTTTAIPAGSYVYAATPEVNVKLSQCEVSFWGTAFSNFYNGVDDYAAEITVGAMTDPTDWTTFNPVKTVKLESAYMFKKFVVSLADYVGDGKYIAFASNAQKPNVFYIDNVSIYAPQVPTPSVSVRNALPSGFEVVPAFATGADSWNVKVSTSYVRDASVLTESQCLLTQTGLTSGTQVLSDEALLSGKTVLVYVQAVKSGVASAWSFPVTLRVPTRGSVPMEYTFNTGTYSTVALSTLNHEIRYSSSTVAWGDVSFPFTSFTNMYPAVSTNAPIYSGGHLNLWGIDNYFALPYVDDISSLELVFRLSAGSASATSAGQSRVAVGVMTDPYDLSTFVQVGTFDGGSNGTYVKCIGDLSSYTGNGHYVAVRAIAPGTPCPEYGSYNAIDNLSLRVAGACREAANMTAEAGSAKVTIRWDAMGMNEWVVRVYTDAALTNLIEKQIVKINSADIVGLASEMTYYYTVQTICGTDTLMVDETSSFRTAKGLPYSQKFDVYNYLSAVPGWEMKSGLASGIFAGGAFDNEERSAWTLTSSNGRDYVSYEGNALCLENNASTVSKTCEWVISPELYLDVESDLPIQLTFDLSMVPVGQHTEQSRNTGVDDQFMVIVSTDNGATWKSENAVVWNNKTDGSAAYVYNNIPMNSFQTVNIDMSKYTGQRIRFAFYAESTQRNADNYILIDNVKIREFDVNCQGILALSAWAMSSAEGSIAWTAGGTQRVHLDVYEENNAAPFFSGNVSDNPYNLGNLSANTAYIVRAYQSCDPQGDTLTTSFRTPCVEQTIEEIGVVTFDNVSDFMCWTVGVADVVGVGSTELTLPHVEDINKFGKVLYLKKERQISDDYPMGNDYYAIMPALDIDSIKDYQVVFSAATNSLATDTTDIHTLYVGVVADPLQPTVVEIIDTIVLPYASDSLGMRTYTVSFDTYEGDIEGHYGKYIMFKASAPASFSDVVLLDNVFIEPVMGCHMVSNMEVTGISGSSVKLQWTGEGQEYEVIVADHICKPDTLQNPVFAARKITDTEVLVNGLQPQKNYFAYIRSICEVGDTARWSGQMVFTTAYGTPYYENFARETLAPEWEVFSGLFPVGEVVKKEALSSSNPKWKTFAISNYVGGMEDRGAYVEISGSNFGEWLISPQISLPSVVEAPQVMSMSFKVAKCDYFDDGGEPTESPDGKFFVCVSTDNGSTWTRSNSTVWASDGTGDYDFNAIGKLAQRYRIDLTRYIGQSIRLGFYVESRESSTHYRFYVDSVAVEQYLPTCDGIANIQVANAGKDYIDLIFKSTSLTDTVEYVYGKESVDFSTATVRRTNVDNTATLSGLEHSSTYVVYARALCTAGDTSEWYGPAYVNTACLLSAPVSFNFDDSNNRYQYTKGAYIENCWFASCSSSSSAPTIKNDGDYYVYSHSAPSAVVMSLNADDSYYSVVTLPELESDLDTLLLTFWARAGYEDYDGMSSPSNFDHSVLVGTMTDPSDTSTFRLLKEVVLEPVTGYPSADATRFWRLQTVSLQGAEGKYIAFMQRGGSKPNSICIDDVEVIKEGCSLVENVTVDNITASSARVHWKSHAEKYILTLSGPTGATLYSTTDTLFALSGLSSGVSYSVAVASVCGLDTFLAVTEHFATDYSIPFVETFDDASVPENWSRYANDITIDDLWAGTNFAGSFPSSEGWGGSSFYNKEVLKDTKHINCEMDVDYLHDAWLVTPKINLENVDADIPLFFSFDAALTDDGAGGQAPGNTANQRFFVVVSEDGGETWSRTNTIIWSDDAADQAQYTMAGIPAGLGQHYEFDFSQYIGHTVQIAFGLQHAGGSFDGTRFHLDNVRLFEVLSCADVENVVVDSTTLTKAILRITPSADGGASQWQYAYGEQGLPVDNMPKFVTNETTFVLEGLVQSTTYDVYVRSVCGVGDSSYWAGPYEFSTRDGLPFYENFSANSMSAGWTTYNGSFRGGETLFTSSMETEGYIWELATVPNGISGLEGTVARVEIYDSGDYDALLVSPMITLPETSALPVILSFKAAIAKYDYGNYTAQDAQHSEDDRFSVIISTDNGKTWTRANSTIWASDGTGNFDYNKSFSRKARRLNVDLTQYLGMSIRIGFYAESSLEGTDTNFFLDSIAVEAREPYCEGVYYASLLEAGKNSLRVLFESCEPSDVIEYVYGLGNVDLATAKPLRADDNKEATLINLIPTSKYNVYARALCVAGDTSEWSGPYEFRTNNGVPYYEEFAANSLATDWEVYRGIFPLGKDTMYTSSMNKGTGTNTYWWYMTSVPKGITGMEGTVARVEVYGTGSFNGLLVSPEIEMPATSTWPVNLSFKAAKSTYTSWSGSDVEEVAASEDDKLSVIISTDGGETWTRSNSTVWASDGTGDYDYNIFSCKAREAKVDLTPYLGQTIRIGFYTESTVSGPDTYFYLDSIAIEESEPICGGVYNISLLGYGADNLHLRFRSTVALDTIEYVYGKDNIDWDAVQPIRANADNEAKLTGLEPSAIYAVSARALCMTGDTSAWFGPVYFTTSCRIQAPVSYNFDTPDERYEFIPSHNMEACWTTLYENSNSLVEVMDNGGDGTYSYNGTGALFFHTHGNYAYAVMPELDADLDTLQLTFWGRPGYLTMEASSTRTNIYGVGETFGRSIKVGVMDNPNDISTFKLFETITVEPLSEAQATPSMDPQGTGYYRKYTVTLTGATGKFIAFASDFVDNYFTIDAVNLETAPSCKIPAQLNATPLSATSAIIRWVDNADSTRVRVAGEDGVEMFYVTVADTLVLNGLQAGTRYTVSAQSCCEATQTSDWSNAVAFTTLRAIPYIQDFETSVAGWEKAEGWLADVLGGAKFLTANSDWTVDRSNAPEEAFFSGKTAFLYVENSYATMDWYLSPVLDLRDADMTQSLYLSMVVAKEDRYQNQTGENHSFVVAVSEDGGATWKETNLTRWDNTGEGDYVLSAIPQEGEQFLINLDKYKGKAIRVALYYEAPSDIFGSSGYYMYVDNFVVDYMDVSCIGVRNLEILSVTEKAVSAQWTTIGSSNVEVQILDAADNVVYSATTSEGTFSYVGLAPNTTYTLQVAQVCGSAPAKKIFRTEVSVPYHEPFLNDPVNWTQGKGLLDDILDGKSFTKTSSDWKWGTKSVDSIEVNINDASLYINVWSSGNRDWMISPTIVIPQLDDNQLMELSMTVAMSTSGGHAKVDPTLQRQNNFAVIISEDAGATWTRQNVTLWNNQGTGDYVYNDIPVAGQTYKIDMTRYSGKSIKVALYADAQLVNDGDIYIYVDDISINLIEYVTYERQTCNSSDYQDRYFIIPTEEMKENEVTTYRTLVQGENNAADTIVSMSLMVYHSPTTVLEDTVCEGTLYAENGFSKIINTSQVLTLRTDAANGCDSLVELHITMLPRVYSDTTIYACTEYTLHGKTYYSNQVLMDTLVAASGCDSVARIILNISPEERYDHEWRTAICAASTYSDELFHGLDKSGTYTETVTTKFGCDSVVTLHLIVAEPNMVAYDTVEIEDLPYVYEGDTIIATVPQKGITIEHDVRGDCGTITLQVFINGEMGINNIIVDGLTIMPNPARVGETVQIIQNMQPEDDYTLTIHDALGQTVYTDRTSMTSIPGLPVSGCYIVRIINGGKVFQAKLIVQ